MAEVPSRAEPRLNPSHEQYVAQDSARVRIQRHIAAKLRIFGIWAMSFGGMLISGGYALAGLAVIWAGICRAPVAALALVPAGVAILGVSLWHIFSTIWAMFSPTLAAPIQVAISQPRWPPGVNALMVVWWLMHVSLGALLAIATLAEKPVGLLGVAALAAISMVFTYTAHGFMLLVVTCVTRDPAWIVRVWGWRRIVSIGHGFAVLAFGVMR